MNIEEIKTIYGSFYCWKDELVARQLRTYSAHTRNELAMLRRLLAAGDCVIDVGAHIGTYAIPFAHFTGPGGRVVAFEASPDNYSLLVRNIEANQLQGAVEAVNAVVSDSNGEFEMRMPPGAHSGMYYFVPSSGMSLHLPSVQVDSWLEGRGDSRRISLVKIDVEGAELSVLRSCLRTISRHLPILYIEICPALLERFQTSIHDIQGPLMELGYHFFRNVGERNSSNDEFRIARLPSLAHGGPFFDLLAVHPASRTYAEVAHGLVGTLSAAPE